MQSLRDVHYGHSLPSCESRMHKETALRQKFDAVKVAPESGVVSQVETSLGVECCLGAKAL